MVIISESLPDNVKKVHCPVCGGRLCDVKKSERICIGKENNGIIIKCYKCGNKVSISIH